MALPHSQQSGDRHRSEQTTGEFETFATAAVGEKAEVANFNEARWQDVE
jgi:hypothetical protein